MNFDRDQMINHLILLGWFATYFDGTPAIAHPDHGLYYAYGDHGKPPTRVMGAGKIPATGMNSHMGELPWEVIPVAHFPILTAFAVEKSRWS